MADDRKIGLEIDIDDKAALAQIKLFNEKTSKIFDQMQGGSEKAVKGFDAIAIATVGINQGLELVGKVSEFVNSQFEKMEKAVQFKNAQIGFQVAAQSIGISSKDMMNAIQLSTGGAVSQMDAMRLSIYALNNDIQASAIPRLMRMAQVFADVDVQGRSTEQIFQSITHAVNSGMYRSIKDLGFHLSTTGDKQKDLNNILQQGEKILGKFEGKFDETGEKIKAYKNILSDVANEIQQKSLPAYEKMLRMLSTATVDIGSFLGILDKNKPSIRLSMVQNQMDQLNETMKSLQEQRKKLAENAIEAAPAEVSSKMMFGGGIGFGTAADKSSAVGITNKQKIAEIDAQIVELEKKIADAQKESSDISAIQASSTDKLKAAKQGQYYTEIEMKRKMLEAQFIAVNTEVTNEDQRIQQSFQTRIKASEEFYNTQIQQLMTAHQNHTISQQMFDSQLIQLERDKLAKIDELQKQQSEAEAQRVLQSYNRLRVTANDVQKTTRDMVKSVPTLTTTLLQGATDGFTNMFEAIGSGSKSAGEAVKGALLGVLADIASNWGKAMFLMSLFPPNPAGMAAGLALMALGGLVRGMAGSSKSSSTASSGGGGGGGSTASSSASTQETTSSTPTYSAEKTERKGAIINIQGDFLNTTETATRLQQIIRQSSDVTDFKIQAVGGGI